MAEQIPEELFGSTDASPAGAIPEELLGPPAPGYEAAAPAQQSQLGWSTVGPAASGAFKRGWGQIGETFGGEGTQGYVPGQEPFEWSDITNPGAAATKLTERIAGASPTIAGGALGSVAGPWGAAAGAGMMTALQTYGHAYNQLVQQGMDPQQAKAKAGWESLVNAVGTATAWRLWPMFSKMANIGVVQPSIAMGEQAARNVVAGQPATQDLGQAYTEGVVGSAVPAIGQAAVRGIGRATGLAPKGAPAAPSEDLILKHLDAITNQKYGAIHSRGINYTNPQELANLRDSVISRLLGSGPDEGRANINRSGHREVMNTLDDITKSRRGPTGTVDFATIDGVRQKLGDIWADNQGLKGDASTARLAAMGREAIDQWLGDEPAQVRAGADPDAVKGLAKDVASAREYSRAARAAHAWEAEQKIAETTADPEKYLARAMQRIVRGGIKSGARRDEIGSSGDYPAYVVQAMADASKPGGWQRIARWSKPFDPHGPLGLGLAALAHSMSGPAGLGVSGAAWLARTMAERRAAAAPERVPIAISSFPSDRPKPQPRPGILKRTQQTRGPLGIGPLPLPASVDLPQERKGGGKVKRALALSRQAGGEVPAEDPATLAATMTHDAPSSPQPYMHPNVPTAVGDISEFIPGSGRGISGVMERHGQSYPGSDNPFVQYLRSPDASAALGMFFPISAQAGKIADEMLKAGATPESLWKTSRIFKDAAGDWRQESLGPSRMLVNPHDVPEKDAAISGKLRHFMDMPHLYERMPEIGDIETTLSERPETTAYGQYNPYSSLKFANIKSEGPSIWFTPHQPPGLHLETLQHEAQHGIDQPSGFLRTIGGDPDWYRKVEQGRGPGNSPEANMFYEELGKFPKGQRDTLGAWQAAKSAVDYDRYKRSIHEVMARSAAHREQTFNVLHALDPKLAARWQQEHPPFGPPSQGGMDVPMERQLIGKPYPKARGGKVDRAMAIARRAA